MKEKTVSCEDCASTGLDPGSLHEPEECPTCCGAGYRIAPEQIERIAQEAVERFHAGRATRAEPFHTDARERNRANGRPA